MLNWIRTIVFGGVAYATLFLEPSAMGETGGKDGSLSCLDRTSPRSKVNETDVVASGFATKWKRKLEESATQIGGAKSDNTLRLHGWALFQNLTRQASAKCPDVPYWLTWKTKLEVFPVGRAKKTPAGNPILQIQRARTITGDTQKIDNASRARIPFSSVHYSPGLDRILSRAPEDLVKITPGTTWDPLDHIACHGQTGCYDPIHAVVIKPIWWVADFADAKRKHGTACLPVWALTGPPEKMGVGPYAPGRWDEYAVLTDGSQLKPGEKDTCQRLDGNSTVGGLAVSLSEIFSLPIDSETQGDVLSVIMTPAAKKATGGKVDKLGKRALLVGVHIISREINTWTWNTYWWVPQAYRSSGKYAGDRPPGLIASPWKNYAMDSSLNLAALPDSSGQPVNAIYNPYQETLLSNASFDKTPDGRSFQFGGLSSNCRSCHENATYQFSDTLATRVFIPGTTGRPDFGSLVRIGFLWSLSKDGPFRPVR